MVKLHDQYDVLADMVLGNNKYSSRYEIKDMVCYCQLCPVQSCIYGMPANEEDMCIHLDEIVDRVKALR